MYENHLALWAGLTALFTNFAAINLVALLGDEASRAGRVFIAFFTAFCVAGAVYAKQHWIDTREERKRKGGNGAP